MAIWRAVPACATRRCRRAPRGGCAGRRNNPSRGTRDCGSPRRSGTRAAARPGTGPGGRGTRRGGETALPEGAEFENQQGRLARGTAAAGAETFRCERAGIEERLVLLAALRAVARVRRKHFAGDLFRHFEGETETAAGVRREQLAPEFLAWGTGRTRNRRKPWGRSRRIRAGIRSETAGARSARATGSARANRPARASLRTSRNCRR